MWLASENKFGIVLNPISRYMKPGIESSHCKSYVQMKWWQKEGTSNTTSGDMVITSPFPQHGPGLQSCCTPARVGFAVDLSESCPSLCTRWDMLDYLVSLFFFWNWGLCVFTSWERTQSEAHFRDIKPPTREKTHLAWQAAVISRTTKIKSRIGSFRLSIRLVWFNRLEKKRPWAHGAWHWVRCRHSLGSCHTLMVQIINDIPLLASSDVQKKERSVTNLKTERMLRVAHNMSHLYCCIRKSQLNHGLRAQALCTAL